MDSVILGCFQMLKKKVEPTRKIKANKKGGINQTLRLKIKQEEKFKNSCIKHSFRYHKHDK